MTEMGWHDATLTQPLLRARGVTKSFALGHRLFSRQRQVVQAVDNVTLDIFRGETLGLVGESGCGKSTLARCLLRLQEITSGTIDFDGIDISRLSQRALRPLRPRMQMVFQDSYASLNPRRRVGESIAEPLRVHRHLGRKELAERVADLLRLVELPAEYAQRFPHEFSGGQRQRIGIARALALEPRLVVADEPVSALDVSIQAQVINMFADLQERLGLTYVFVAHDLSVVRQISTRTAVMYLGSIVEIGPTDALFQHPAHPYSEALISAVPVVHHTATESRQRIVLQGDVPSPINPPAGCRFHPRCRFATDRCRAERPKLAPLSNRRMVACHYPLVLQDHTPYPQS